MTLPAILRNGTFELLLGSSILAGLLGYNVLQQGNDTMDGLASEYASSKKAQTTSVHKSLQPSTRTAKLFPCKISTLPTSIGFDGPLSYPSPKLNEVVSVVETNVGPQGAYHAVEGEDGRRGFWMIKMLDCKGVDAKGVNVKEVKK
jgi:hypothetical protein